MSNIPDLVSAGLIQPQVALGPMTTYKIGGNAEYFATVNTRAELDRVLTAGVATPITVLGRGSNLLVATGGVAGLVLRLGGVFSEIEVRTDAVHAGAGVSLPVLARTATKEGNRGLEFFVGVPGSVGGAVRMNAGCHGIETRDVLDKALVLDAATGAAVERGATDLELSYRHSNLGVTDIVLSAVFLTTDGDVDEGEQVMRDVTAWRRKHQPGGTHNAGSVFKNPPGDSAGRLIDSAGLKGLRVGGASVSTRHANFIEASEQATPEDVYRLIEIVRTRVADEFGVELIPEIICIGFEEPA
ncbi:UDP-N-acetylenolpyruvoylglucosamine reductase [bacterium BMS3Bbin02]|nr:UDP-N-acetylenolpyruvoylglucosamine reductase [bacterium BMS3Bbin02]